MELLPVLDEPEPPREEKEVTIEHTDLTEMSTESNDIFYDKPVNKDNIKTIPKKTKRVRITELPLPVESDDEGECDYHAPPLEPELEIPISPPPKPKKQKSEKQLAHLKRIRVLAADKKRAIRLEKAAIEKEVKDKIKKKKAAQQEEDDRFSRDFKERMGIASDEQLAKSQEEKEQGMYKDFLLNMKKYKHHKDLHRPTPSAPPPPKKKPTSPPPCAPINIVPENPYTCAFDW